MMTTSSEYLYVTQKLTVFFNVLTIRLMSIRRTAFRRTPLRRMEWLETKGIEAANWRFDIQSNDNEYAN